MQKIAAIRDVSATKTLIRLPTNFKCADVICDFCGYLGQVKTTDVRDIRKIPNRILGAAWGPQDKRMTAGFFFPLFLVLRNEETGQYAIHYLAADLQTPEMFVRRAKLKETARRAALEGFIMILRAFSRVLYVYMHQLALILEIVANSLFFHVKIAIAC